MQQVQYRTLIVSGTGQVKFYPQVPGNVTVHCQNLLKWIESEMPFEATNVNSPVNCDVILAFCPVVSRLGTDVQAIVKNIPGNIIHQFLS